MLDESYELLAERYRAAGLELPENEISDRKRHYLDCLAINSLFSIPDIRGKYSVVRGAFEEGEPVFPGATIRKETHIQLAVRDPSVIGGLFRPVL
jgi:hypothetical protein